MCRVLPLDDGADGGPNEIRTRVSALSPSAFDPASVAILSLGATVSGISTSSLIGCCGASRTRKGPASATSPLPFIREEGIERSRTRHPSSTTA